MIQRTVLEFSVHSDKKLAFYGGEHARDQRRDILKKWKESPTSEGNKERGFGVPHKGRKIRLIPRGSGELITKRGPPPGASRERRRSPHRSAARDKASYLGSDVELTRRPLLLDEGRNNPRS